MDPITGDDPYAEFAERIIFHGLTKADLSHIGSLKPGKTFSDLCRAVNAGKRGGVRGYEGLVAGITEALRENIILNAGAA